MKPKKIFLIITFLFLTFFISACSSTLYASSGWHGLASSTDTVYLAAGNQVYAIDLNTGSENWRYPAKVNSKISFYANPMLTSDGQLLLSGYDSSLYSVNPVTGSENWIFTDSTNRLIASPLVTQNMIYQPSTDGYIYAIDLTGKAVWSKETDGPLWARPADNPDCDCIFVASMDHMVYSFDASTGRMLWKSPDLGGAIVSTPAVSSNGTLFIGTFGKEMIALDATNGAILWRFTTQDWVWSGPALADEVLYFGDLAGYFYALNATDGTSLWRIQPQDAIVDTPIIVEDKIYLTTESDKIFIVSTAGEIISSKVIGGMIYSSPVVTGDTVLVAPTNFDVLLVALNLDGNQKWTFTPAK